jgi:ABC-type uncharacterized transport system ATPase subunit
MSAIELRNVTKHFGAFTAVKDLSLSVSAGEVVCLWALPVAARRPLCELSPAWSARGEATWS